MVELLLGIIAGLLAALLGVVGYFGRTLAASVRLALVRVAALEHLHLRCHPEDLDHFKPGGSQ